MSRGIPVLFGCELLIEAAAAERKKDLAVWLGYRESMAMAGVEHEARANYK